MSGLPRVLVPAAILSLSVGAAAQSTNETASGRGEEDRAAHPIVAPATPPPASASAPAPRAVSSETAAKLAAFVPPYQPAKPTRNDAPRAELPEEKPKNGIIRLPRYVVEAAHVPKIKERQLLTPEAKVALGFKLYPGLRLGSLPFFTNAGIAYQMVEEDLALQRRKEMTDLISLLPDPTTAQDKDTRKLVEESLVREPQFSMPPSGPMQLKGP